MDLTKLTRKELIDVWVSTQGDLTVPPHLRECGDRKLINRCFVELLRRSPNVKGGLNGVKR